MGLEGIDEGGGNRIPELAAKLENQGERGENADILNLYLDGANINVAAPEPISAATTTEPLKLLVFNTNYSRNRYGKSAVHPNVNLDSVKKSLLLDSNMSESGKALAFISSLEFDKGLEVLQNEFSDSDVTNRDQPNLDNLNEYPESLFNNATELNTQKETFVFDAVESSQEAIEAFTSYQ